MEVFLYNSTVCRLCGEENDNGTFLYSSEDNSQNISDLVNTYLPLRVSDDNQLPRTICPGCTIQLEATVEFINLIINGQKVIRALHQRESEYKKTVLHEQEKIPENYVAEVDVENGVYAPEHQASLASAGLEKPRRKRGRPPKKHKTPEELAMEAAAKERELQKKQEQREEELSGKRRRKAPTRFQEVVQGKELEKIFIEEGVIDREEIEQEVKPQEVEIIVPEPVPKVPEVIGHTDSGELVVIVKGKGRGRPKGRLNQKRQKCAICDKEFSCLGRYMSHVAQHGPVMYQCQPCMDMFATRLEFNKHQEETGHQGQNVLPLDKVELTKSTDLKPPTPEASQPAPEPAGCLPDLNPEPIVETPTTDVNVTDDSPSGKEIEDSLESQSVCEEARADEAAPGAGAARVKLPCPHCDKMFSTKQSKSMHIKAIHRGERPYRCTVCGAVFAYPRALSLHSLRHRAKGYACDLCGKVLNHPSSVTYHKESEHFNQKFVCVKCGKSFKHKQLLQRHQLVHSQHRPHHCKTCNASFKTKANLANHQMLHSGVKKFSCDLCKQRFAHKTSLTLHMRWHTGHKPFVCKVCGKSFSQSGNLSEHARIHSGEKPFQCVHCPRRFTTSSQHRLHLRRHALIDERTRARLRGAALEPSAPPSPPTPHTLAGGVYRCGWCARACATRWSLAKHVRRHTGERPFQCPHCPRAFADCSNLSKHKRHIHRQMSLLVPSPKPTPAPIRVVRAGVNTPLPEISLPERPVPEETLPERSLLESTLPERPLPERTELVVESTIRGVEERVIYVTYDVDDPGSPDYKLVDHEESEELLEEPEEVPLELYSDTLLPDKLGDTLQEHMAVTDEQGNPLHFTMQDGTQLAITSIDGHTLQVVTEDGQTIPVEINEYTSDVQLPSPSSPAPPGLDLDKSEDEQTAPVSHYFTIE